MFCSNCGAKLDDSAVFCGECGTKVKVEPAVAAAVEETKDAVEAKVEEVKNATETVVAETVVSAEKAAEEAPASEKKKGGKGGLVALIIVLVLLLAAGGVAAWYFTSDDYNCKKNLKQAEEAFAAGELDDAKDYYETVLEYDETQKDIYVKLADIAIQDGDYESAINTLRKAIWNTEDVEGAKNELNAKLEETYVAAIDDKLKNASYTEALSMVEEAINEWNTPALVQKKKDIYLEKITAEMAEQDYWGAVTTATGAFRETGDKDFAEKTADVYIILAQESIDIGDYTYALGLMEQGLIEVGDSQKLEDAKVALYKTWIDRYIEEGNYISAIKKAESSYVETKDETFNEKIIDIYLSWSDEFIRGGDYAKALDVLEDGVRDTQSEKLTAKIEEINNSQMILSKQVVDKKTGTSVVYEYNEKGLETKITYFDEYGSAIKVIVYEYDGEGNVSECRTYDGGDILQNSVLYTWTEAAGKKQCEITYVTYIEDEKYVTVQEIVDEKNNPLSYTEYKEDGSISTLKQHEYDEAGNLLKEMIITDEETITNQYQYTYDDAGNMVESVRLDAEGEIVSAELFEYDENGNVVTKEVIEYFNGEETNYQKLVSEYDENDKLLHAELFDKDGMSIASDHIEYDEKGNETYVLKGLSGAVEEYIINYEYGFPEE